MREIWGGDLSVNTVIEKRFAQRHSVQYAQTQHGAESAMTGQQLTCDKYKVDSKPQPRQINSTLSALW